MQELLPNALTQFQEISMSRRHVYFYVLLFLSAALLSNVWESVKAAQPAPNDDVVRIERMAGGMAP